MIKDDNMEMTLDEKVNIYRRYKQRTKAGSKTQRMKNKSLYLYPLLSSEINVNIVEFNLLPA